LHLIKDNLFFNRKQTKPDHESLFIVREGCPKKKTEELDVAYKFHKPEFGSIIFYYNGQRRLTDVSVFITDEKQQVFECRYATVSPRSGIEIELKKLENPAGGIFSGAVSKVAIYVSGEQYFFVQGEKGFRRMR